MMAWRADDDHVLHHNSDPWRVSSLIRAFFELIFALCVLLCAVVFMTTARLIKSLGLLNQNCTSCYIEQHHHRHSRQESSLRGYQSLADSCDLSGSHCTCGGRCGTDPTTPMGIMCEDRTHFLSDRVCASKRGSSMVTADTCTRQFCSNGVTSDKNIGYNYPVNHCGSDHTIVWAIDDDTATCHRRRWRCSSSIENESSCDDGSGKPTVIDRPTVASACGCECRSCLGIPAGAGGRPPASSRSAHTAFERKFAKVFPNDNSNTARGNGRLCSACCSDHHSAHMTGDSAPMIFISEGGADKIRESELDSSHDGLQLMNKDSSSSRLLSDGSRTQNPGRVGPEDSARGSSRASSSHKIKDNNRNLASSSLRGSSSGYAYVSGNPLKLSTDSDLLASESSTPAWCENCASLSPYRALGNEIEMNTDMEDDVMEVRSTVRHEQDPEIAVMERREEVPEEQEALEALYLELEEERNAASTAAHEAMAMITRLQEEKAAIQMEARQYQRMAEEKHQYDQESMAMLQEILVKREEEVDALEEEVDKYRKGLLTLGMDELMDRSTGGRELVGSPKSGDVLLIEWDTQSLEGRRNWKNRTDIRDEKLLTEIKDWLHDASEKVLVAPEEIEELNVLRRNFLRYGGSIDHLLPDIGKKNLLESFRSVPVPRKNGTFAVEDIQRDAVGNENFEAQRDRVANEESDSERERIPERITIEEVGTKNGDTATGYELFQGMMESLGREPSLQDEESLETLKKIEEKFRTQSSDGEIRLSGDELRQIWQNTLRSFESGVPEDSEARAVEVHEDLRDSPTTADMPENPSDSPHHDGEVADTAVDVERQVGEKRMSVLEYVWKFEEQFHQLANKPKPSLQPTKSGFSTLDESVAEARQELNGTSSELVDSNKSKSITFGGDRPSLPIKTRLRKRRAADLRNATTDAERDRLVVRGEGFPSTERATRNPDARFDKSPDFEGSHQDGCSVVHDVYEVPQDLREAIAEGSSSHFRDDKRFSRNVKKYVSSTRNELVRGQFIDNHETAHCVEQYLFDNGGSDFVGGHLLDEHEANGKGRPDQYCSSELVRHSVKGPEWCTQAGAILSGEYLEASRKSDHGCTPQLSSSVLANSPRAQMQDVVQQLTNRLKALETDRQILQDTIASLQMENGETKNVQDISQQLRELQGTSTNVWSAVEPGFVSSIKGILSWDKLRHSMQSQLSKMVQLFLANGDPGGSQGDHQVGFFRLLHESLLSKQERPIERARPLKAVYAANRNPSVDQVQPFVGTVNPLVPQYSWLMNAKERSDTAFRGWDY